MTMKLRRALFCLALLLFVACSGLAATGKGGSGGSGSGGSGGGRDGGQVDDAGHDTSGGSCWRASDCRSGTFCTTAGQSVCGGACAIVTHPCASDSDCASDGAIPQICVVEPCVCGLTNMGCLDGCASNADCGPGESCGSNHHCGPIPCGAAGQSCPTDFACGTSGTCARKGCTTDSQCSKACVEGLCYGAPGTCQIEAP